MFLGFLEKLDYYDQLDGIKDGAFNAAGAQEGLAKETLLYSAAIQSLQDQGIPITYENINKEVLKLSGHTDYATKATENMATTAPSKLGAVGQEFDNLQHRAWVAAGMIQEAQERLDRIKSKTVTLTINVRANYAGNLPQEYYESERNRQFGGLVQVGKPYMVGEAGPEMFVPNTSGKIVPNNQLSMGGGGGMMIGEVNFFIDGSEDPRRTASAVMTALTEANRAAANAGIGFAG